jgi:hypothetical protein
VTVIKYLGVQLRQLDYRGGEKLIYLDKDAIQNVVVNEGLLWNQAVFYAALLVRGQSRLTLAFTHLYPRLPVVVRVYHSIKDLLKEQ